MSWLGASLPRDIGTTWNPGYVTVQSTMVAIYLSILTIPQSPCHHLSVSSALFSVLQPSCPCVCVWQPWRLGDCKSPGCIPFEFLDLESSLAPGRICHSFIHPFMHHSFIHDLSSIHSSVSSSLNHSFICSFIHHPSIIHSPSIHHSFIVQLFIHSSFIIHSCIIHSFTYSLSALAPGYHIPDLSQQLLH